jgi:transformation/transcription domain-associated protein
MKEVQQFLNFIKNIYKEFPKNINLVFNFKPQIKVHDISDINIDALLDETFSSFQILTDKYTKDNQIVTFNVIPRGSTSLKVLAECPMNTILMFQMNRNLLSQDIPDVIPLIANLIALQATEEQRLSWVLRLTK